MLIHSLQLRTSFKPTLVQRLFLVHQTLYIDSMLIQSWATVYDVGPTLNRLDRFLLIVSWVLLYSATSSSFVFTSDLCHFSRFGVQGNVFCTFIQQTWVVDPILPHVSNDCPALHSHWVNIYLLGNDHKDMWLNTLFQLETILMMILITDKNSSRTFTWCNNIYCIVHFSILKALDYNCFFIHFMLWPTT